MSRSILCWRERRFPWQIHHALRAEDKVRVQNSDGLTVAIVATDSLSGRTPDTNGRVVFNCMKSNVSCRRSG